MSKDSSNPPINIVVVEDDNFLADLYRTKFELEGFKVHIAYDGEKGLETIKKALPDIILLDLMLPKMSGFAVLEELKKDAGTKDIPVVLLTNLSQKADVTRGLSLGANDYLIKAHFMPSEVVSKIKHILKRD